VHLVGFILRILQTTFFMPSATDLLGITIKFITTCQTRVRTAVQLKTKMSRDVKPGRWLYKTQITLHYIPEVSNLENYIYSGAIWLICIIKTCIYFEHTLSHTHTHTHTHIYIYIYIYIYIWCTRWRGWLRHCATCWKVAG